MGQITVKQNSSAEELVRQDTTTSSVSSEGHALAVLTTCWLAVEGLSPLHHTCMMSPEVTMGEIPSSMRVPLLEAMMTLVQ